MNMYQLNQHPLLLKTLCSFFDNFDRGDKLTMSTAAFDHISWASLVSGVSMSTELTSFLTKTLESFLKNDWMIGP